MLEFITLKKFIFNRQQSPSDIGGSNYAVYYTQNDCLYMFGRFSFGNGSLGSKRDHSI